MAILSGKVALVTGGGRGIGRAVAILFAKAGANIWVNSLTQETSQKVVEEISAFGGKANAVPGNVSDPAESARVVNEVVRHEGKLNILVNNAGITRDSLLVRMKDSDWEEVLNVNLRGVFLTTREAAKIMMKQKEGSIINISSVVGVMGNPGQANYAASKAGVIGFTKAVARELAGRNITVNAVAPGFIETDMTRKLQENVKSALMAQIPLGRLGQPEDVAETILFLSSPGARYITGQVILVDGGMGM